MLLEDKLRYEEIIKKVIKNAPADDEDWVKFTDIGGKLNLCGINLKKMGYTLLELLDEFNDIIETKYTQSNGKLPVYYARLRNDGLNSSSNPFSSIDRMAPPINTYSSAQPVKSFIRTSDIDPNIYDNPKNGYIKTLINSWAAVSSDEIWGLAQLALDEKWYYGSQQPNNNPFPILYRYLNNTFIRLCYERKIAITKDKEYAAFNTGLVDNKYDYIYALFTKIKPDPNPFVIIPNYFYWSLSSFVVPGEGKDGKILKRNFNELPQKAYYLDCIGDMFYNPSYGKITCDIKHILKRIDRLPKEFLLECCGGEEDFLVIDGIWFDDAYKLPYKDKTRGKYFEDLGEKIKSDNNVYLNLSDRFGNAVNLATKRAEWNYKTAVPMYYPKKNSFSFSLPLALTGDVDEADIALVVTKEKGRDGGYYYQGQTILPLSWAYSNSRLIARPDTDWLRRDSITEEEGIDEDE